ncbi:nuclear GTPase SLIP-GC-like isoform 2-T2 [Pholidichthys leucotaenia]
MDEFVRDKLNEWGLSELIEVFKAEEIDKESLLLLEEQDIGNLARKIGHKVKLRNGLKRLKEELGAGNCFEQETDLSWAQIEEDMERSKMEVLPSTSDRVQLGKRKYGPRDDSSQLESPTKRQRDFQGSEAYLLKHVKTIMDSVKEQLGKNKLSEFLRIKIKSLETDKRELVGVFGRTGVGKSSLINAIIGAKNLLPSGDEECCACTSVMIKVEANRTDSKYRAEIEFINEEEWEEEAHSWHQFLTNKGVKGEEEEDYEENDEDDGEAEMSALYGNEWKHMSPDSFMNPKYFKKIPEFLMSKKKEVMCATAKELSAKIVKYTKNGDKDKQWFWPLVKCVTVKVPNSDLLKHVTLVDIPGTGDNNKSRDRMWKEIIRDCSTVWIVTDISRAASEKEAWEILENASSLIGNGGECQKIDFICTKSDICENLDDLPPAEAQVKILKRNKTAKEKVKNKFQEKKYLKEQLSDDRFKVFTVSSKEFFKRKHLDRDETEIPKLQKILQTLNDEHSETNNYVSGAYRILSLIQGATDKDVTDEKREVCSCLQHKFCNELVKVQGTMEKAHKDFKACLNKGVEESILSCEKTLHHLLYWRKKDGEFHRVLKCVVKNDGVHKPKKGEQIDFNLQLSSQLTHSINDKFRKTFSNDAKAAPYNGAIKKFSLKTDELMSKHSALELQLSFLKTEEEKVKAKLHKNILKSKKEIYSSLTETIQENMQEAYKKAAEISGKSALQKMRDTIENHMKSNKEMFELAKNAMLEKLNNLQEEISKTLKKTLQDSIEFSLNTEDDSLPDVSRNFDRVKKYYDTIREKEEVVEEAEEEEEEEKLLGEEEEEEEEKEEEEE